MANSGRRKSTRLLYDNCLALGPDGAGLFYCDRRKADAYLKHGSAEMVSAEPFVFRLLFRPGGPGTANDPCLFRPMPNRCVVCGAAEELTKHHIVPYCYRRWFPAEVGYLTMYDVMGACVRCHDAYEPRAEQFKRDLEREYQVPNSCRRRAINAELQHVRSHANALLTYLDRMPPKAIADCLETVRRHFGRPNITRDDLMRARDVDPYADGGDFIPPALYIVRQLTTVEDIDRFAVRWREHFLKTMRPRFMPPGWTPHRNANGSHGRADRGAARKAKPQPLAKCRNKVRYRSERAAKSVIRRRIRDGDVTAVHLQAYRCERHGCYHIGNRSTALKFISFTRPPAAAAD